MDKSKFEKAGFAVAALIVATGGGWAVSHLLAGESRGPRHGGSDVLDTLPAPSARKAPPASPSEFGKRDTSVVAWVGGDGIRRWLLDNAVHDRRAAGDASASLERSTLENLVQVALLYQEATQLGYRLDSKAGALRMDMVRRGYKDSAAFAAQLAKSGMTPDEYAEQWRRQATIEMFVADSLRSKIRVDDDALKKLYARLASGSREPVTATFEEAKPALRKTYEQEKLRLMVDSVGLVLRRRVGVRVM